MSRYVEIAHLVRALEVDDQEIRVTLASDCGEFEQTVDVARELVSERNDSRSDRSLAEWVQATLRRFLRPQRTADELSEEERAVAVEEAFRVVRPQLVLNDGEWHRRHTEQHPSELFDRQLRAFPITRSYDLEVLVRVLLEVSRSDSDLRVEERAFLKEIVTDQAMIDRLSKHAPITVAELAETSSVQVKETILMLAWAMAYADGRLDPEEMNRLNHLCQGFNLPETRVRALQLASKLFLLDRHLDSIRGQVTPAELCESFDEKARAWGVAESQLEKLRAWYPSDFPDSSPD